MAISDAVAAVGSMLGGNLEPAVACKTETVDLVNNLVVESENMSLSAAKRGAVFAYVYSHPLCV